MASVKIILRSTPNKQGDHPLALQIIKDRRKSLVHLGQKIRKEHWDAEKEQVKKSHPNAVRLNNFLLKKKLEAADKVLAAETKKTDVSASALRQSVKPDAPATFFAQAKVYLDELKKAGKYNRYTADKPLIGHFRKFAGHEIGFSDITPALLERFKTWLQGARNLSERSAVNALVTIRCVFSQAIKDELINPQHYPFGKGKVKISFPESSKIGLTPAEIKRLENTELADERHHHARNLWLVSFYFAGMRASDVLRLRWSDIQDGRLHYTMGKNKKTLSVKIPDKAVPIFEQYRMFQENADGLIFPDLKKCDFKDKFNTQRTVAFRVSAIDKFLRREVTRQTGIDKKLTMHIARHSFAQNAKGMNLRTLQHLFRHSKFETTETYMGNYDHDSADAVLDAVLALEPEEPYNSRLLKRAS